MPLPPRPPRAQILIVEPLAELGEVYRHSLIRAGFDAMLTLWPDQAWDLLCHGRFDAVVVSLNARTGADTLALTAWGTARPPAQRPGPATVAILDATCTPGALARFGALGDAAVGGPATGPALVAAVDQALALRWFGAAPHPSIDQTVSTLSF